MDGPHLSLLVRLRELYEEGGWGSLKACAEAVGFRTRTVGRYLSGERLPPAAFVEAFLAALAARTGVRAEQGAEPGSTRWLYYASLHAPSRRPRGPWDISEVDNPWHHRLDLGSLLVPVREPGLELAVETAEESGVRQCVAATVLMDEGVATVQLQAFTAAAGDGLWEQVRTRMSEGVTAAGGSVSSGEGALGIELSAVLPEAEARGRDALVRFAGCDGPGWLLRGTFTGAAALPGKRYARRLDAVFRDTVVAPGHEPGRPGDILPLTPPPALGHG